MNEQGRSSLPEAGAVTSLARRRDFRLGDCMVRPSLRMVEGTRGAAKGEPRVMQVLLALADAKGAVLSRDDLLRLCWDGRIVGDDAVHRAVAALRRMAAAAGASFEVETVPRVGYRLIGIDWDDGAGPPTETGCTAPVLDRRRLVAGGIAAMGVLAAGGTAAIWAARDAEIDALIAQGRLLQGSGQAADRQRAEALFRKAAERDPRRADAWGWLAIMLDDPDKARAMAQRAHSLDPAEPNARVVLALQRRDLDEWTQWEDMLLAVLADAPDNVAALTHLTLFYQGMGRCRDSWSTNERAIRVEPFNPTHLHRRALKHWIFGRVAEADKVADQAMRLWPRHAIVWNARMLIYACTDRAPAALALLDDVASRPAQLKAPSIDSWRAALHAIATRSDADMARALEICTASAALAPGLAAHAIMIFSYLGQLDAAYHIAAGLFEGRGAVVQRTRGKGIRDIYSDTDWGRSQFLFIPATASFRADDRFADLCRRTGHVRYWQRRKVWPDPFVRGVIDPAALT